MKVKHIYNLLTKAEEVDDEKLEQKIISNEKYVVLLTFLYY